MPREGTYNGAYLGSSSNGSSRGGRGRGRGRAPDRFEREQESHADRAAKLFELARASSSAAASSNPVANTDEKADAQGSPPQGVRTLGKPGKVANVGPADGAELSSDAIPLPLILKSLANPALGPSALPVKEAIPLAGKLVRAKLNNQISLAHLNGPVLEEAGISSESDRHRIMTAFGVRALKSASSTSAIESASPKKPAAPLSREAAKTKRTLHDLVGNKDSAAKRKRQMNDEQLSREYGNVTMPASEPGAGALDEYLFNEVLEVGALRGRYVLVNRAPIMTAWTTIVLERLGFQRREALSLAHCYVHTTSTSRGISLGIIPASERNRAVNFVGANQPHFELMNVKIPLMKLGQVEEWRGISQGQIIGPDQAFNYMRRSMHQTLPLVMGALTLLADSFVTSTPDDVMAVKKEEAGSASGSDVPSPDLLHGRAYELYTLFRPSTAGEWGKKSHFYCDKALALRKGHEDGWADWVAQHGGEDDGGQVKQDSAGAADGANSTTAAKTAEQQAAEAREFEEELQRLVADGADEHEEEEEKPQVKSEA